MYLPYSTVKDKLLGQYQVFGGHDNLRFLKTAKEAIGLRHKWQPIIQVADYTHFFHEKSMYQFHEQRELTLTMFNYRFMPANQDSSTCTFKWVYVQTPLAIYLIRSKSVVAVFKNGFNLFGFHIPELGHDVEESFLMNPIVQQYALGI